MWINAIEPVLRYLAVKLLPIKKRKRTRKPCDLDLISDSGVDVAQILLWQLYN